LSAIVNTVLASINHISLPSDVSSDDAKVLEAAVTAWLDLPVQIHVFDFKGVQKLHRAFYPPTAKFKKDAESKQTKLISINLSPEILAQIKADGVERAFGYMKNLNFNNRPASRDSLEETRTWLIKYAINSGRAAMNMMFNTTVAADENYRETPKDFAPDKFFKVAVIHAESPRFSAAFRLYFEKATLEALARVTAETARTEVDQELLLSTASELLNIIYTSVKSKVNDERGYQLPPALPALVDPAQLAQEKGLVDHHASWIPFVTPLGAYYLQIDLRG
jgi:hypothetical protein